MSRINVSDRVTCSLTSPVLFHAVGQGALGVEIRTGDGRVRETMRGIGHWPTEWRCGAERGCLRVLEGGCSVPVGVESELEELNADQAGSAVDEFFTGEMFTELEPDSPMLWFSGIVDSSHRLPSSLPSTPGIVTPVDESSLLPFDPDTATYTETFCQNTTPDLCDFARWFFAGRARGADCDRTELSTGRTIR